MAAIEITEPFPISAVAKRYFLYDADIVAYIRRQYNILGVLMGTLPQVPQQNVFLGLPLELMPEEARLLVEKGANVVAVEHQGRTPLYLAALVGQLEAVQLFLAWN